MLLHQQLAVLDAAYCSVKQNNLSKCLSSCVTTTAAGGTFSADAATTALICYVLTINIITNHTTMDVSSSVIFELC